jgi:hypothetical protein
VRVQVLTVVRVKMFIFWDVGLYSLVKIDGRASIIGIMMEVVITSETSVSVTTLHGATSQKSFIFASMCGLLHFIALHVFIPVESV